MKLTIEPLTQKDLCGIALTNELNAFEMHVFVRFMIKAMPQEIDPHYAGEIARRIKTGIEGGFIYKFDENNSQVLYEVMIDTVKWLFR